MEVAVIDKRRLIYRLLHAACIGYLVHEQMWGFVAFNACLFIDGCFD